MGYDNQHVRPEVSKMAENSKRNISDPKTTRLLKFFKYRNIESTEIILNGFPRKDRGYLIEGVPHQDGTESDASSFVEEEELDEPIIEIPRTPTPPPPPPVLVRVPTPPPPKERTPTPPPPPTPPRERSPTPPPLEGWRLREQQRLEAKKAEAMQESSS